MTQDSFLISSNTFAVRYCYWIKTTHSMNALTAKKFVNYSLCQVIDSDIAAKPKL